MATPQPSSAATRPHPQDNTVVSLIDVHGLGSEVNVQLPKCQVGIIKEHSSDGKQIRVEWSLAPPKTHAAFINKDLVEQLYDDNYTRHADDMKDFKFQVDVESSIGTEFKKGHIGTIIAHDLDRSRIRVWVPWYPALYYWVPMQKDGKPTYRTLEQHDHFPFKVIHAFTTQNGETVEPGDEGIIFAHDPRGWVRVAVTRYNRPIVIPKSHVEVGIMRAFPEHQLPAN